MKIGYLCGYDKLDCGESEARLRWTYVLEKLGHIVIPLNKKGETFDTKIHADNLNLDFMLSTQVVEMINEVCPDVFTCFQFWCPNSFLSGFCGKNYLLYTSKYDCVVGGYESENPLAELAGIPYFSYKELCPCTASVPSDFAISRKNKTTLKFFYAGMLRRYENLMLYLENKNLLELYGPEISFDRKPWEGFKSYKGCIPFDGKSSIKKMNEAGVVLALHSKCHNKEHFVSNRIYEAAAAGAVIIADDNRYIRKYFGDSVYYIDIFKNEEEQEKDLSAIIDGILKNPDAALKKAEKAQKIFLEKLSLDHQAENLINFIKAEKSRQYSESKKRIDCIVFADSESDFYHVQKELKKQIYKNLKMVIVSSEKIFKAVKQNISLDYVFVEKDNDFFGEKIFNAISGDYFFIMDGNSCIHKNHLYKAAMLMSKYGCPFAYSGSYIKNYENDAVKNYTLLSRTAFNLEKVFDDMRSNIRNGMASMEFIKNYPVSCFVFDKKILDSCVEMCNIPYYAVQLYLSVKHSLKSNLNNCFMYTVSAGVKSQNNIKQSFLYDNVGHPRDEITEKIAGNLSFLLSQQEMTKIEIPVSIQLLSLRILLTYVRIRCFFSIKNKDDYKHKKKQIKTLINRLTERIKPF